MTARKCRAGGGPLSPGQGRKDSGWDSRRIDGDSGEDVRPLFPRHERSRVEPETERQRREARGKRQETVEWPSHLALQDEPARAGLVAEKPRSAEIGPGSAPGGRQFHLHHAVMRGLEGASCD